MRKPLYVALVLLYLLHNDLWWWDEPRLIAGWPVQLLFHVGYSLVVALVLALVVRKAFPLDGARR